MDNKEIITSLPFYSKLSEQEKSLIVENSNIIKYNKGSILYGGEESCLGMVFLINGSLRAFMLSEEGREVTLFHIEKGDCCVFSASCVLSQITFETQLTATEDSEILLIKPNVFGMLMESNVNVKCFAYELAMTRFSSVVWVLQQIIFLRLDQRLVSFLVGESDRTNSLQIHMTQEAIAREINTAREVVARMLSSFAKDSLVEIRRGLIIIKDIDSLKKML